MKIILVLKNKLIKILGGFTPSDMARLQLNSADFFIAHANSDRTLIKSNVSHQHIEKCIIIKPLEITHNSVIDDAIIAPWASALVNYNSVITISEASTTHLQGSRILGYKQIRKFMDEEELEEKS